MHENESAFLSLRRDKNKSDLEPLTESVTSIYIKLSHSITQITRKPASIVLEKYLKFEERQIRLAHAKVPGRYFISPVSTTSSDAIVAKTAIRYEEILTGTLAGLYTLKKDLARITQILKIK